MVICSLLLEISSFIREIYPQIVKKPKPITHIVNREINVGSVFSNDSSSISALNDSLPNQEFYQQNLPSFHEQEVSSTNLIEITPKIEIDTTKHISFAFGEDSTNKEKISDIQINEFEINHADTIPIVNNQSSKSFHIKLSNQTKRSSFKHTKKASIKSKIDRTLRSTYRRLSYNTHVSEIREQREHELMENNGNISDVETIGNNIFGCPILTDIYSEMNDDIADAFTNKTFPWIKVNLNLKIFKFKNIYMHLA